MGLLDDAIREHLDLKRSRGADPTEVERNEREALGPVRRTPQTPPRDEALLDSAFAYDHEDQTAWSGASSDVASGTAAQPNFGDEPFEEDHIPEPEPEQRPSRLARLFGKPDRPLQPDEGEVDEHELEYDELEPEPAGQRIPPKDTAAELDSPRDTLPRANADPTGEGSPARSTPPYPAGGPQRQTGGETVEYDVKDALGSAHPGNGEDAVGAEHPRTGENALGSVHPGTGEDAHGAEHPGTDEDVLEETPEFLQDTPDHDRLWFEQRPPRDFDFDR